MRFSVSLEAREVDHVPLAAPRDERRHVEALLLAIDLVDDACTIHAPVAELVRLLVRLDPTRAVVRDLEAHELGAFGFVAEPLVKARHVTLVRGDEAAPPIGRRIAD